MAGIRHLIDTEAHKALFDELREDFETGLALAMQSAFLPGMVMPFSGSFGGSDGKRPVNPHTSLANEGFALCDGGTYQASKSSPLMTTPDLRGRFVMGASSKYKDGTIGGDEGHTHTVAPHTLTVAQMPAHRHSATLYSGTSCTSNGCHPYPTSIVLYGTSNFRTSQGVTPRYDYNTYNPEGGSQPHSHGASEASSLPPYYALAYIMKL